MRKLLLIIMLVSSLLSGCKNGQLCVNNLSLLITKQFQTDSSLSVAYRNGRHLHYQKLLNLFCGVLNEKSRILLMDQTFAGSANKQGLLFIYDDNTAYTYDYTGGRYKTARGFKYDLGSLKAMLNAYKDSPIIEISKVKETHYRVIDGPSTDIFYVDLSKKEIEYWYL